jgi:hypothetical protein
MRLWSHRCRSRSGGLRCPFVGAIQFGYRAQHFAPMAKHDPEFLQVLIAQIGKYAEVNPILIKALRVLPKIELSSQSAICCTAAPTDYRRLIELLDQHDKEFIRQIPDIV